MLAILLMAVSLALGMSACGESTDTTSSSTTSSTSGNRLSAGAYHLQDGGKTIVESGRQIPVKPKSVAGYVDNAIPAGKSIGVSGWAVSADLSGPADAVVAFVDGRAVAAQEPTGERADVAKNYGRPELERSGFGLIVPVKSLNCTAPAQGLEVFGITGGTASRLDWLGVTHTRQHVASQC